MVMKFFRDLDIFDPSMCRCPAAFSQTHVSSQSGEGKGDVTQSQLIFAQMLDTTDSTIASQTTANHSNTQQDAPVCSQ